MKIPPFVLTYLALLLKLTTMKKILFGFIAAASLAACNSNSGNTGTETLNTTPAPATVSAPAQNDTMLPGATLPGTTLPGTTTSAQPAAQTQPAAPQSKPVTAVSAKTDANVKLNPAHGQPGHRCDISVGAPLNSAPATVSTTPQPVVTPATTPVITPSQPAALPGSTTQPSNVKLNPAHGQPGHDCSIAVGQPLKQ